MICSNCGFDNNSEVKYCTECGNKLPVTFSNYKTEKEDETNTEENASMNDNKYNMNSSSETEENKTQGSSYNYESFNDADQNNSAYTYEYNDNEEPKNPGFVFGVASFVLAMVALVIGCCCCTCFSWFVWLMIILEIASIALGIISLVKKERKKAFPIIGIVIAGILLVLSCSNRMLNFAGKLGNAFFPTVQYNSSQYESEIVDDFIDLILDNIYGEEY